MTDLATSMQYRFKVSAFNINGEGPMSDEMVTYACQAPSQMPAPQRISSTATTMTIRWEHPDDNGGCPISSYAVFRNDGNAGAIEVEANAAGDTNVRNRPTLDTLTVTNFPATTSTGKIFSFKVTAFNIVQSTDSDYVSFVLASVPSAPMSGPVGDDSSITRSEIKVDFSPLTVNSETGGAPVLGYHLQISASDSVFADIFGQDEQINVLSTNAMVSAPLVTEGVTYGFRYRARNIYGWGDWSPVTYILAASVPSAPPTPTYVSATENSITVDLYLTEAWNGALFESHELWMAEGQTENENDFT